MKISEKKIRKRRRRGEEETLNDTRLSRKQNGGAREIGVLWVSPEVKRNLHNVGVQSPVGYFVRRNGCELARNGRHDEVLRGRDGGQGKIGKRRDTELGEKKKQ